MKAQDEEKLIQEDIYAFLDRNQKKELLRFVTVGSVDDGKSTLIGRLLHDTKGVYDDQLKDATLTSTTGETAIDFARITDGLRAEREQGITIDVAYRYFSTPARKFIIADTPGHVQYTRNMATGASTAHVALILIDARLGVLTQSRRHATIASLLGIPHLLVCVNKMDLVDYDEQTYLDICSEFSEFSKDLGFRGIEFLPVSALFGINIVDEAKAKMPWYSGHTVLRYLETVEISHVYNQEQFRMPIQCVLRPNLDYRGYSGQIVSGVIKPGDPVMVMPSGVQSEIEAIDTFNGELTEAYAPMSITLRLRDEIDASRGDILINPNNMPKLSRYLEATVVWMSEEPLNPEKDYWIKHGTQYLHVNIESILWKINLDTLEKEKNITNLDLNDIACVRLITHRPLTFDAYAKNRHMGAFIFIDFMTNNTVGAGMIRDEFNNENQGQGSSVSREERANTLGQLGQIIWLQGSNRSERSYTLERLLFDAGYWVTVIDSQDPRYAPIQSAGQAARIAKRMADAGLIVLCSVEGTDQKYALEACSNHLLTVINLDDSNAETKIKETIKRLSTDN
jgi:bifunctional enzyme CysN/CysC